MSEGAVSDFERWWWFDKWVPDWRSANAEGFPRTTPAPCNVLVVTVYRRISKHVGVSVCSRG